MGRRVGGRADHRGQGAGWAAGGRRRLPPRGWRGQADGLAGGDQLRRRRGPGAPRGLVRLSALLHEAPHGLTDQSRNARQMTDSSVAGDGWGIGWFGPEAGLTPGLLKSILPLWSDENAKTATHAIRSGSVVGHIRYASP